MIGLLRAINFVLLLMAMIAVALAAKAETVYAPPLSDRTLGELKVLYRKLIDAENIHDLAAVKSMLFPSPVSLFISRTEPVSKGDWGGYWGTSSIVEHFGALYSGTFRIDPDYAEERVVGLTPDVAETYAPVIITSGYGGQAPIARRFLMVLEWVKTPDVGGSQPTNPCRYRPRHRSFIEPSSPVTSERQKSRQTIPTSDLLSSRTTPSVVPW